MDQKTIDEACFDTLEKSKPRLLAALVAGVQLGKSDREIKQTISQTGATGLLYQTIVSALAHIRATAQPEVKLND